MSNITLDEIKAQQTRLAEIIAAFEKATQQRLLMIYGVEIALDDGEHYAGAALNDDGSISHHVVLMADRPDEKLDWKDGLAWAAAIGGALPTRQEASLIFANCKPHIEALWHWTSETYEPNASYAWYCYFGSGYQGYYDKDHEGCCRAVRRVNP